MFITGPQVVEQVLHQKVSKEDLGGAWIHAEKSGVAHFVAQNEEQCFEQIKKLLSYLPANYLSGPVEVEHFQEDNLIQKVFLRFKKTLPQISLSGLYVWADALSG